MRLHLIAAAAAAALATVAVAQPDTGSHNPATKNPTAHTTAMAAKGRNSFTEGAGARPDRKGWLHRCEQARQEQERGLAGHGYQGRRQRQCCASTTRVTSPSTDLERGVIP